MTPLFYIKTITLLAVISISTYFDIRTMKIPNKIVFAGMLAGLMMSQSAEEAKWKAAVLVFLFFFGMLGLMGMGDIKLWMCMAMYINFLDTCYIIAFSGILLIVHQFLINKAKTMETLKLTAVSLIYNRKLIRFDQEAIPFSPYILTVIMLYDAISLISGVIL